MTYQGSIMKSTLTEELPIIVKNYQKQEQEKSFLPKLKIEYQPFHHPDPPLILELHLNKARLNIEADHLEGYLKFKDINQNTMESVVSVNLELVHQEI